MTVDRTISYQMRRIADSWVTEINYWPDCVVALWEGPQHLLAKVKDADRQDWYIFPIYFIYIENVTFGC